MNIFNSLGSNYNLNIALQILFAENKVEYRENLTRYLAKKYAGSVILTYKGRTAIELALESLKLPKGSVVAVTGFTCLAVEQAIIGSGLDVEYLDIEKNTLNFSAKSLESTVKKNPKIKVVIIQNTLGFPCDMENILKICKEKKLILIEDLAHSVGTLYDNGKEAGMVGDFVALSFSQDKMIDGVAGGALVNRQRKDSGQVRMTEMELRMVAQDQQNKDKFYPLFTFLIRKTYPFGFGKFLHWFLKGQKALSIPIDGDYKHITVTNWYCMMAKFGFEDLEKNLNHRRKIARVYANHIDSRFHGNERNNLVWDTLIKQIGISSNMRFPIFVEDRNGLIKFLKKHGIYVSDIWYDAPVAPKRLLDTTQYKSGECQNGEWAGEHILNLPTHKNVSAEDAREICRLLNEWVADHEEE